MGRITDSAAGEAMTAHARARMQQRGIAPDALEHLLAFGREAHDHRGAVLVYFDKAARRRLAREAGEEARSLLPRVRRLYAVLSAHGEVVTVGHRYRRIPRND
jgi:hypothetical protein